MFDCDYDCYEETGFWLAGWMFVSDLLKCNGLDSELDCSLNRLACCNNVEWIIWLTGWIILFV